MISNPGVMSQIIREGMDYYWKVLATRTDAGLSDVEIEWKRDHERAMARMEKKFGAEFDEFFRKETK